jgi:hypothetical protein
MRGFSGIDSVSTSFVRFVRADEIDGSEAELFSCARSNGVRISYLDLSERRSDHSALANALGESLQLENAPYQSKEWLCFSDDLITLAYKEAGLVVVVDGG